MAVDVQPAAVTGGPAGLLPETLVRLPVDEVYRALASTPAGLSSSEAEARRSWAGLNRIVELPGPPWSRRLAEQFVHLFALLLWAGALLALIAGEVTVAAAIVAVIVLNGVFGFVQEHAAERAVAALKRLLPGDAAALRDGAVVRIGVDQLVPGDVVVLEEGDRVPADLRLVMATDLRCDESSLTGEASPTHKVAQPAAERPGTVIMAPNLAFAGTTVTSGEGTAVVFATGMGTQFGRIAALTQAVEDSPSPLQIEVGKVAKRVALLSLAMGAGFFFIGHAAGDLSLRGGAIFAIGIVLGNVPEGLLPTMTLALAMGVKRMASRNAIVKRLSSVETLGSCTVICTDKTGTVTENQMTVRELWAGGRSATVTGSGYEPVGRLDVGGKPAGTRELAPFLPALRVGQLCNSAALVAPTEREPWRLRGDPTEGALLVAAAKAGLDRQAEEALRPLVRKLAFDPRRKRMSTIHRSSQGDEQVVVYVKGAPRELLAHCSALLRDGVEVALTPELRQQVAEENDRLAAQGLRVLAMAYRHFSAAEESTLGTAEPGQIERHLVLAGLIGMQDPPRPEVADAVAKCHQAGIRIVMITGDYGLTAASVARQVGIVGGGPLTVVDGGDLDATSDDELRQLLAGGQVLFARATPEHKLRVVSLLRAMGEVVAVTGDGVNDAPALKRADIGVAMGRAGTDVAREAADMILVDDNFATIVGAVEEGRAIFDNMRKFIVYIFAHLSPEALPFILYALFRVPLPLTVMQILAIDLGTETLPALALGIERPEPDVMARPPRPRSERLLSGGSLLRGYAFLGGLSTAVVTSAFFLFLHAAGWRWGAPAPAPRTGAEAATIVFLGIVVMQVGNAFACRTERASVFRVGLAGNRLLLWGIAFELAFVVALIYLPWLHPVFQTASVPLLWWVYFTAFLPAIFFAEELRKRLVRGRAGAAPARSGRPARRGSLGPGAAPGGAP